MDLTSLECPPPRPLPICPPHKDARTYKARGAPARRPPASPAAAPPAPPRQRRTPPAPLPPAPLPPQTWPSLCLQSSVIGLNPEARERGKWGGCVCDPLWKRKKRKIGGAWRTGQGFRAVLREKDRGGGVRAPAQGPCSLNDPEFPPGGAHYLMDLSATGSWSLVFFAPPPRF